MTQTVSFKDRFKSGFAIFKSELKSCTGSLTVFSILASVMITIVFTLALVIGYAEGVDENDFDYNSVLTAISVFQVVSTYLVFILNAVFTIVYTIRIYSYLHNKRKADLYGSMPISRRTFFVSKTISAFVLSVIPTMFFFGIISIMSVLFGQAVLPDVAQFYVKLPLGAIACISFYGLLAVCCGTTLNSVLSFIGINFAYPISTLFIKGTIKAFFIGMPSNQYNSSFIMKALNPLSAYNGTNVIYWIFFTAACLFLGIWLVKKRRAECAQTSFAYYLPCHIVKLLVSFIIGMFFGTLFGSLNVLTYGFAGFMFGFILGSVPAYIITHLILHKGFSSLIKSSIPFGAMVVTVFILMTVCNFDFLGYNSYVPDSDNIRSAGLIDLDECCFTNSKGAFELASMASDDYEDKENIETVTKFHQSVVKDVDLDSNEKYASVWSNILLSNFSSEYFNNSYCVAYRLDSGRLVFRYYDEYSAGGLMGDYTSFPEEIAEEITDSDTYFINYNVFMNGNVNTIEEMRFRNYDSYDSYDYDDDYYGYYSYDEKYIDIAENEKAGANKAKEDRRNIIEAYRKDVLEKGVDGNGTKSFELEVKFEAQTSGDKLSLVNELINMISAEYRSLDRAYVYSNYTNTIAALKEAGILDSDGKIKQSDLPYNYKSAYDW